MVCDCGYHGGFRGHQVWSRMRSYVVLLAVYGTCAVVAVLAVALVGSSSKAISCIASTSNRQWGFWGHQFLGGVW